MVVGVPFWVTCLVMTIAIVHSVIILLVACLAASPVALADQNDPRLEALFDELAHSDDASEAQVLLAQINQIWIEQPDPDVARMVLIGTHLLNVGALRDATTVFQEVTRLAPDYAEGWNRLATVLYYRGLNAEALAPTRRVLELEPRHYGATWGLAMIYRALGREEQARWYFQLAYAIAPSLKGALSQAQSNENSGSAGLLF